MLNQVEWLVIGTDQHGEDISFDVETLEEAEKHRTRYTRLGGSVRIQRLIYSGPKALHVGSPSMLAKLEEVKPKLYVCGHIHAGYGVKKHGETVMVNASYVNERYQPVNNPIVVEL